MKRFFLPFVAGLIWLSSFQLTLANTPPSPPQLVYPANQDPDFTEDFLFLAWEKSTDPDGDPLDYDLFLGTTPQDLHLVAENMGSTMGNDSIIADLSDPTHAVAIFINHLKANTSYYWKVTAKDGKGNATESERWSFTIGDINIFSPTEPSDPKPSHMLKGIGNKPSLSWKKSIDRDGHTVVYDLYLGTSETATSLIASELSNPYYQIIDPLAGNTRYFWQVVAKDGRGKESRGEMWEFTTGNTPPEAVVLLSPADADLDIPVNTELSWEPAVDPDSDISGYEVWYGTSILPNRKLVTQETFVGLQLAPNTTYYWKVIAMDSHGDRSQSDVWRFTTGSALSNLPPAVPQLSSPAHQAVNVSLEPSLTWQAVADPDGDVIAYDLFTGTHPDSLLLTVEKTQETSHTMALRSGTAYYWQTVAYDGKGGVSKSDVHRFITTQDEVALSNFRVYYRYRHASRLHQYRPFSLSPAWDLYQPQYTTLGNTGMNGAVALVFDYQDPGTGISIDVPEGFTISASIIYDEGLPRDASKRFKIEGDFSSNPTVNIRLSLGSAERNYQVQLQVNKKPTPLHSLVPEENASGVSVSPVFGWKGGDDPEGSDILYRILLGTDPNQLRPAGTTFNTKTYHYTLNNLRGSQKYYWKVEASDKNGGGSESAVQSFITEEVIPPPRLTLLYPREISTYVGLETELAWSYSTATPHTYDVYLDVTNPPRRIAQNLSNTRYAVENLAPDTQYYWQVVAKDNHGTEKASAVWKFRTKPANGNETGTFTDKRDGQVYQWVRIHDQKWMTHNLAYKPKEKDGYYGYQYWFDTWNGPENNYSLLWHQESNLSKYGYLYNWNGALNARALTDTSEYIQGVCPCGWRVATYTDWAKFHPLQEGTTVHYSNWGVSNKENEWLNQSGLSILPSSFRNPYNPAPFETAKAMQFWLARQSPNRFAVSYRYQDNSGLRVSRAGYANAASVRCVKVSTDNLPPTSPQLTLPASGQSGASFPIRLEWAGSTDPDGDALVYEVYVDTLAFPAQKLGWNISDHFYTVDELQDNTTYYWKVRAIDIHGEVADSEIWSFTTEEVTGNTAPGLPILLQPAYESTGVTYNPTLFTWQAAFDAESDPISYNFYLGRQPEGLTLMKKDLATTSFSLNNLEPRTSYYWQIMAKDGRGGVTESQVHTFTTLNRPPTAPQLITPPNGIQGVLKEQILDWRASTDPDGDVVFYTVYVGTSPSSMAQRGNTTTYLFYRFGGNAIPNNTTYYWQVVATDKKGGETASEIWSFTTHGFKGNIKPSLKSPANLATGIDLNPTLEWNKVIPTRFTYDIYLNERLIANNLSTDTYTINEFAGQSQLKPHTTYKWEVVTKDIHGAIGESGFWHFTTKNEAPSPPALIAPSAGATNVPYTTTLSWQASTDTDGDLLAYHLYLDENPNPVTKVASGQNTDYTIDQLKPNTTYYWKVVADDNFGGETASETRSFTIQNNTVNSPPSAPELLSPANYNGHQTGTVTLTWNPAQDIDGDAITYDVYLDRQSNLVSPANTALTDLSYVTTGLQTNVTYYWKVVAKDAQGGASSSVTWHFTTENTAPEAPVLLSPVSETRLTATTALLTWQAAQDADNDPVTYDVYLDKSSNPGTKIAQNLSNLSFSASALENNTTYYWKVVAKDPYGGVAASEIFHFKGKNEAPSSPQLISPGPGGITVMPQATLQWQASTDVDNTELAYEIHWGTSAQAVQKIATVYQQTSYITSDLTENTPYYWKIVARDTDGGTAVSPTWSFTYQLQAPNQPPTAPVLLSPSDQVTGLGSDISLSWASSTDPEGEAITYSLYLNQALIADQLNATTFALAGLEANRTYTWRVVARDPEGNRSDSPRWKFTVGQIVPQTFAISGRITHASGEGLSGVALEGLPQTVTSKADGYYHTTVQAGWNGTVTPMLKDYTFQPQQLVITNLQANQVNKNFTATYSGNYTLSGRILDSEGSGLPEVVLHGFGQEVKTDTEGRFSVGVSAGWSGVITPQLPDHSFNPADYTITSLQEDKNDLNFSATWIGVGAYQITGVIKDQEGTPLQGIALTGFPGTVNTDDQGRYATQVPAQWSGTVRSQHQDYTFSPPTRTYTQVQSSLQDQNFEANYVGNYLISGTILDAFSGPIAEVNMTGFPAQTSTDKDGFYQTEVPAGWSGKIVPVKDAHRFIPEEIRFNNVGEDKPGQDFQSVQITGLTPNMEGLVQVFPNPSSGPVEILLGPHVTKAVSLEIVSTHGHVIKRFDLPPGNQKIRWDGNDDHGISVPSGIYPCRVIVDQKLLTTLKIVIIR